MPFASPYCPGRPRAPWPGLRICHRARRIGCPRTSAVGDRDQAQTRKRLERESPREGASFQSPFPDRLPFLSSGKSPCLLSMPAGSGCRCGGSEARSRPRSKPGELRRSTASSSGKPGCVEHYLTPVPAGVGDDPNQGIAHFVHIEAPGVAQVGRDPPILDLQPQQGVAPDLEEGNGAELDPLAEAQPAEPGGGFELRAVLQHADGPIGLVEPQTVADQLPMRCARIWSSQVASA